MTFRCRTAICPKMSITWETSSSTMTADANDDSFDKHCGAADGNNTMPDRMRRLRDVAEGEENE